MTRLRIWLCLVTGLLVVGALLCWTLANDDSLVSKAAHGVPEEGQRLARTSHSPLRSRLSAKFSTETPAPSRVTLHGTVLGSERNAINDGVVCLISSTSASGNLAGDASECVNLTPTGHFELETSEPLPDALLAASAKGYLDDVVSLSSRQLAGLESITVTLQPAQANLLGRVLDANGGTIAGATIRAQADVGKSPASGTAEEPANAWLAVTLTDELGRFQMSLPAGPVRLIAEASGYSRISAQVWIGEQPERTIELALAPASVIAGRLLDEESRAPIVGVSVEAQRFGTVVSSQGSATTDSEGGFRIQGLTAGSYRLTLQSSTWAISPTTVPVDPGTEARTELLARRGGSLVIRAKLSNGKECASGFATFDGKTLPIGEDGRAVFTGVIAGDYRTTIICSDGEPTSRTVTINAEDVTEEVVELAALTTVQGRVTYQGEPVSGVLNITLASDTGTSVSGLTSQEGAFRFSVGAGNYSCFAETNGKPISQQVRIDVGVDDVVGVELHLLEALGSVELTLQQAAGEPKLTSLFLRSAQGTVTEGTHFGDIYHRFDSVALGRHDVVLGSPNGAVVGSVLLERANETVKATIAVDSHHSVRGSVVDSQGQPIPDAWVALSPMFAPMNRTAPVLTDGSGLFDFANLVAGTYRVFVESPWGRAKSMIVTETDDPVSVTLLPPDISDDGVERD